MQIEFIASKLPSTSPKEFGLPFALFTILMLVGGIVWGTLCIFFELYPQAIIPYGYTLLSAFNFWYWQAKENFKAVRVLQVSMSILLPFLFQIALGGYAASGTVMLWAVLALIACITFHKTKGVLVWLFLFAILVIITVVYDAEFIKITPDSLRSQGVQQILLIINVVIISSMIFFLGRYFIGLQRKAIIEVNEINDALKESEQAKEMAYQEVLASEEELRQNTEELRATNNELLNTKSELESAIERVAQAKIELEKSKDSEITKKSEKIMSSLRYAERIQRALLPSTEILKSYLPESFLFLLPRDIVSGDFYWFQDVVTSGNEIKLIVAAADCTGHGVPAAFMSIMGHDALNTIVKINKVTSPELILDQMNNLIVTKLHQGEKEQQIKDGMDVAICTLTFSKDDNAEKYACTKVEYAGAKTPLVYIKNGKIDHIKATRKAIGGEQRSKHKFTKHKIPVEGGITLYLFSDGYQDQFGSLYRI